MAAAHNQTETRKAEEASLKQVSLISSFQDITAKKGCSIETHAYSFQNHCRTMTKAFDNISLETKVKKKFLTEAEEEVGRRIISETKVLEIVILILNETYTFLRNFNTDFISLEITKETFDEIQDSVKKNQENIRRTKDVVFGTLTEVKRQKIHINNYIGNREEYIKNTYIEEANQLELEYTWFSKRIYRRNEFFNAQERLEARKDDAKKAKNYLCQNLMANLQNIIDSFDEVFGIFNMICERYKDRETEIIKIESTSSKHIKAIFLKIQKDVPLHEKLFNEYSRAEFSFRSTLFVVTGDIDCQYICDRLKKIKNLLGQTNMSAELWRNITERIDSYQKRIDNSQKDSSGSR